ncbi:tetrapyrrole biosynthesis, uroporphyrinogen III synthase [Absidia repens]|uniref:Tetrapyrrole biosynthesis, uroporphyrinogen III synthase n=1 Tax=Absidia repens TaxID=90262 RepID=A0A1X2I8Y9_9FUNG|nr:tetrapyrrole biosynthesis, uroporphyrinogen III synthase [Absidia repens]
MRLWFFKAHTEEYQVKTEQAGYEPRFITVLDQKYTSDALIPLLQQGPSALGITGIIITSQRSVTTLSRANSVLTNQHRQAWQGIPLYIVGETTTSKLVQTLDQQLFFLPHQARPSITTTDYASQLADHLVQQQRQQQDTTPPHLLFLAGDKRREALPTRLCEAGYQLTEIQTYETCRHPDLAHQLDHQHPSSLGDDWSIFFSPSGVDYLLSLQPPPSNVWLTSTKIAAIGHTTATHLQSLGYQVHAIAAKPSIAHLLDAIVDYDQNRV